MRTTALKGLCLVSVAALTALGCAAPRAAAGANPGHGALPFIDDDYPAALARARAARLPLFIETWAPW